MTASTPLYSTQHGRKMLAVAPMMDWTDRHCRYLHRLLTRESLLYTEMVVADAAIHGKRDRLLGFDPTEHPVALQLGGSEPAKLAEATRIGNDSVRSRAVGNIRRLSYAGASAGGRLHRGDEGGVKRAGDGEVPYRRR
jgi:hypothetical protein